MLTKKEAVAIMGTVSDGPAYNTAILRKLDEVVDMMGIAKQATQDPTVSVLDEDEDVEDVDVVDDEEEYDEYEDEYDEDEEI